MLQGPRNLIIAFFKPHVFVNNFATTSFISVLMPVTRVNVVSDASKHIFWLSKPKVEMETQVPALPATVHHFYLSVTLCLDKLIHIGVLSNLGLAVGESGEYSVTFQNWLWRTHFQQLVFHTFMVYSLQHEL